MIAVGVDVGTTNCKAVALDENGALLARSSVPMPPEDYPDAEGWLEGFRKAFAGLLGQLPTAAARAEIACSIATQGGSFVPVDAGFAPVHRGCCWTAKASQETIRDLAEFLGAEQCYRQSGFLPDPWLAGTKMREFAASCRGPRRWRRLAAVPEFIHGRCGGPFLTDVSNAQLTVLYDFPARRWDPRMLGWAGLTEEDVAPAATDLRVIFERPMDDVVAGWAGTVRFATSSHDQYAAMLAAGLRPDGPLMIATGTAWVISGKSAEPLYDFDRHLVHPGRDFATDAFGYFMGLGTVGKEFAALAAAAGLDLADAPALEEALGSLPPPAGPVTVERRAGAVSEGGRPVADPRLAVRRYMEWVASRIRWLLERSGRLAHASGLVMTGGAARGALWPQMLADTCGVHLDVVRLPELTAYGAALAAGAAVGLWPMGEHRWPAGVPVVRCEPSAGSPYAEWYADHQRDAAAEG